MSQKSQNAQKMLSKATKCFQTQPKISQKYLSKPNKDLFKKSQKLRRALKLENPKKYSKVPQKSIENALNAIRRCRTSQNKAIREIDGKI